MPPPPETTIAARVRARGFAPSRPRGLVLPARDWREPELLHGAQQELALLGETHLFDHAARYYRRAFAIEPAYAEAVNDLAMLYLTAQWEHRDPEQAQCLHDEACAKVKPGDRRRDALVARFEARRNPPPAGGAQGSVADAGARRLAHRVRRQRRRRRVLTALSPRRRRP